MARTATTLFDQHPRGRVIQATTDRHGLDTGAVRRFILDWLRCHGATPAEDIVTQARAVFKCDEPRAFGGVFHGLAKAGLIEGAGFAPRKLNGSPGIVWRIK